VLIVLAQTAKLAQPGKGALNHPTLGKEFEAMLPGLTFDDFDADSEIRGQFPQLLTGMSAIRPQSPQAWKGLGN
jgi:hypothetical protein